MILILPVLFIRLFLRSFKDVNYRRRWLERLGCISFPESSKNGLWFHAVSLGESAVAIAIIKKIRNLYPHLPITLTTSTITSANFVHQAKIINLIHLYIPYDIPLALNHFLKKVKPKKCIIIETELWPNMLECCTTHNIELFLVNARLSPRSFNGYKRLGPQIMTILLEKFTFIAAQSNDDKQRLIQLGARPTTIENLGNVKFDFSPKSFTNLQLENFKNTLNSKVEYWVAASTHELEEEMILQVHQALLQTKSHLLLILVPRHPERFKTVEQLVLHQKFKYVTRSSNLPCDEKTQILLGDTMGELSLFYALATFAFIGGSLVPVGGHNALEAASLSIPTLSGPYVHNFVEITNLLEAEGALIKVQTIKEMVDKALYWLINEKHRQEAGSSALKVFLSHRGAVHKIIKLLKLAQN